MASRLISSFCRKSGTNNPCSGATSCLLPLLPTLSPPLLAATNLVAMSTQLGSQVIHLDPDPVQNLNTDLVSAPALFFTLSEIINNFVRYSAELIIGGLLSTSRSIHIPNTDPTVFEFTTLLSMICQIVFLSHGKPSNFSGLCCICGRSHHVPSSAAHHIRRYSGNL